MGTVVEKQPWYTYQQLVAEIERLCSEQRSGTLSCTTDMHTSATVVVREGTIVALAFRLTHGPAALPLIRQVGGWRFRFQAGRMLCWPGEELPNTATILQQLWDGKEDAQLPPATVPWATPPPSATPRLSIEWSFLRNIIEEEANKAFGPIGGLLSGEQVTAFGEPQDMRAVEQLLSAITAATGERQRGATFRNQVLARCTPPQA